MLGEVDGYRNPARVPNTTGPSIQPSCTAVCVRHRNNVDGCMRHRESPPLSGGSTIRHPRPTRPSRARGDGGTGRAARPTASKSPVWQVSTANHSDGERDSLGSAACHCICRGMIGHRVRNLHHLIHLQPHPKCARSSRKDFIWIQYVLGHVRAVVWITLQFIIDSGTASHLLPPPPE